MSNQLLEGLVNQSEIRPKPPHPISAVGTYIGPITTRKHCWESRGIEQDIFNDIILPEIKDYLQGILESAPSEDRLTISLYMIGKSPLKASPTITFISENESYREKARKAVKMSNVLSPHPKFKTAQIARDPGF